MKMAMNIVRTQWYSKADAYAALPEVPQGTIDGWWTHALANPQEHAIAYLNGADKPLLLGMDLLRWAVVYWGKEATYGAQPGKL
jgi:hypothetical protein